MSMIQRQYNLSLSQAIFRFIFIFQDLPYWQKLPREEEVTKSQILLFLRVELKDARIKCCELLNSKISRELNIVNGN